MVSSIPSIPMYTVISSSYSTFKSAWAQGKSYKVVSTAESLCESVAAKVVSATSGYTNASTLREMDVYLRPTLLGLDITVSPYVENTVKFTSTQAKNLEPAVAVAKKVLPVNTVTSLYAYFLGVFMKNLERVGSVMLIKEQPETKLE
jgi:hypothetical protein